MRFTLVWTTDTVILTPPVPEISRLSFLIGWTTEIVLLSIRKYIQSNVSKRRPTVFF